MVAMTRAKAAFNRMGSRVPKQLRQAIESGEWRNPGPDALRSLFRIPELDDLRLFKDLKSMRSVARQVDVAGWIADAAFCMVRTVDDLNGSDDTRLVFDDALFIGGSVMPGDDVLVAIDLNEDGDPPVFVFLWDNPIPSRWVHVGRLSRLLSGIQPES